MSKKVFTRRCTPAQIQCPTWLVLVGAECKEHWVEASVPDEDYIRRVLKLSKSVEIIVGRP